MYSKRSTIVWLALLMLTVPGLAHASREGRLVGKVLDPKGEPIQGVTVVATAQALPDFRVEDTSNKKGVFIVDIPQLGVAYLLRFEKVGYAALEAELTWDLAGTQRKEFTLQPAGAVQLGTEPLATTSNAAVAAFNAGLEAFKAKDYAAAEAHFQEAVEHDPELRQAWAALSVTQLQQGHNQQAAEAGDKAVALGSNELPVLRARWEAYRNLGDKAKAAAALKDVQKAGEVAEEAKATYNDAVALLKSGDNEAALTKFQEASDLDPSLRAAAEGVATTALKLGHNQQAASAAERILAQDPHDEGAARIRFNAYLALGDPDKLVGALVGLAPYEPKVAHDGLLKLAFDAYDANDMPKAKERFLKVLQLTPDDTVALYYGALVEVNLGDTQEAIQHLEHFLELAPNDKEATPARQMLEYLQTH
jgi:tetratricopeptide (TPR) repeat protein